MFSKQVIRIGLVAAILEFSFPQCSQMSFNQLQNNDDVDRQIYQRSLIALRNVMDVQDELDERLENLSDIEKKVGDKKKDLRLVAKDIEGVFPRGKENLSVRARGFARRIRDIDQEQEENIRKAMALLQAEKKQQAPVARPKSGKGIVVGVLVGAMVSLVAGFFFWKVVGKRSEKKTDNSAGKFIDSLDRYLESVR